MTTRQEWRRYWGLWAERAWALQKPGEPLVVKFDVYGSSRDELSARVQNLVPPEAWTLHREPEIRQLGNGLWYAYVAIAGDERAFVTAVPVLSDAVREVLDDIVSFDGHNDFVGAGGQVNTKVALDRLVKSGTPFSLEAVGGYLGRQVSTGKVRSEDGVKLVVQWIRHAQSGRRFKHNGRYIT